MLFYKLGRYRCKLYSTSVKEIVDEISKLTLIEANELIQALKERFQISNISASIPLEQQEAHNKHDASIQGAKAAEKTEYSLVLRSIESGSKPKIIKEIKQILPGLNLVEAKAFVESSPKLIKDKLKKEEAESLKKVLELAGAKIDIE